MAFRFREECRGYHHGQTDCVIIAYDGNEHIGGLEYSSYPKDGRKEALIQMVGVKPAYQRRGVGAELVRQLAKSFPYEAIDWGMTTPEGHALKARMDQEFGTSYKEKEPDEEPDPFDPKYNDDLDNSRYHDDLVAWRNRNGYLSENRTNFPSKGIQIKEGEKVTMSKKLFSIDSFHGLVREMVKEAIKEEMIAELGLAPSPSSTGTKPGTEPQPGATGPTAPGSNMDLDQLLQAASKEKSLDKKKDLINQASQLLGVAGAPGQPGQPGSSPMGEGGMDEPEQGGMSPHGDHPKVNTRKPMSPELLARIANKAAYGETDEEIMKALHGEIASSGMSPRWVKFVADMARKELLEGADHLKSFQFKKKGDKETEEKVPLEASDKKKDDKAKKDEKDEKKKK